MRILVQIGHPAHVHFFKNFMWEAQKRGHEIFISAIDKEVTLDLLRKYNFNYDVSEKKRNNFFGNVIQLVKGDLKTYKMQKQHDIDLIIGIPNEFGAHVSKITKAKSIGFTDTEHAKLSNLITFPFIDVICTPSCYKRDIGKKQIRYNGYHELAYLHPNYFTPNPEVLDELGLDKDEPFMILRFVSWNASHDVGQHGINNKVEFVRKLEEYCKVLITSEGELDDTLENYRIRTSPEKLHDLLYYASLYVGDGATTATECAILGTPSIYVSSLVGTMGNFIELENNYGLIFNYSDPDKALDKAVNLIQKPSLKADWKQKRDQLLKDKIDVTAFMVELIENYPNFL